MDDFDRNEPAVGEPVYLVAVNRVSRLPWVFGPFATFDDADVYADVLATRNPSARMAYSIVGMQPGFTHEPEDCPHAAMSRGDDRCPDCGMDFSEPL